MTAAANDVFATALSRAIGLNDAATVPTPGQLPRLSILTEPVAATLDYFSQFKEAQMSELNGKTVQIIDVGGGTFDMTAFKLCQNVEVKAETGEEVKSWTAQQVKLPEVGMYHAGNHIDYEFEKYLVGRVGGQLVWDKAKRTPEAVTRDFNSFAQSMRSGGTL